MANQRLIRLLCSFLGEFAKNVHVTKMGFANLALVFVPNILYPFQDGDTLNFGEPANANVVFAKMIENSEELFEYLDDPNLEEESMMEYSQAEGEKMPLVDM